MTTDKKTESADINALASEVMDLWQDHLAAYAADPAAKSELMRLMEPQRRLFADWAQLMQNGGHVSNPFFNTAQSAGGTADRAESAAAASGSAAPAAASDDGALRLAQLAHRTAQLEKHVAELERQLNALAAGNGTARAKTARRPKAE